MTKVIAMQHNSHLQRCHWGTAPATTVPFSRRTCDDVEEPHGPPSGPCHRDRKNRFMPAEPPQPPAATPRRPRVHVTPEELERFGDEEQVRTAWDESRLRDEQPPHHR